MKELPKGKTHYSPCNNRRACFTSDEIRNYDLLSCQKVLEAPTFLFDNIYIRCDSKLYRQIVDIPIDTNFSSLEDDLCLIYYERDLTKCLRNQGRTKGGGWSTAN